MKNRISTLSALALDLLIQRKITRRGIYNRPEDDKTTQPQSLNELKNIRARTRGYEAPKDQDIDGVWRDDHLHGEAYHNRYGAGEEGFEVVPAGPLEERREGGRFVGEGFRD